jgi:hypothetical protein
MYDARTTRTVIYLALLGLVVSAVRLIPYILPQKDDPPPPRVALARDMQTYELALEDGSPLSVTAFRDVEGLCKEQASDDRVTQACQMFDDARHHDSNHDEIDAAINLLKQSAAADDGGAASH